MIKLKKPKDQKRVKKVDKISQRKKMVIHPGLPAVRESFHLTHASPPIPLIPSPIILPNLPPYFTFQAIFPRSKRYTLTNYPREYKTLFRVSKLLYSITHMTVLNAPLQRYIRSIQGLLCFFRTFSTYACKTVLKSFIHHHIFIYQSSTIMPVPSNTLLPSNMI